MSNSVRPHRWQPTRLPHPWDSPGKNTGVGCHFLLQCRKVKRESEVAQSCPTLREPMDCSLPGSSVHGIFQARVLEWGAITSSARDLTAAQKQKVPGMMVAGSGWIFIKPISFSWVNREINFTRSGPWNTGRSNACNIQPETQQVMSYTLALCSLADWCGREYEDI